MSIPLFGLYDYIIFSVFILYTLIDHLYRNPFKKETILKEFKWSTQK